MFNNIITFTMKYNLYIMKTSTWTQLAFCLLSSVFMHAAHHTSITWMRLQEVTKTTEPHLVLPGKV